MRTKESGTTALRDALNFICAAAAWFSFAAVYAKNLFQTLKPPVGIAKIGRRMQTAF
jgi:hypothetical protein